MPSKQRRGRRVGRSNRSTTVVTQLSQGWDLKLASAKDSCHLSSRVLAFSPVALTGGAPVLSGSIVSPEIWNGTSVVSGVLGQRPFSIGANYLRYRINRLLACWRPAVGTQFNGRCAVGFFDDPAPGGAFVSPTLAIISDLRCSHEDSIYRDIEVEWTPIDKTRWYYVDAESTISNADIRLESPCAVTVTQDNYGTGFVGLLGSLTLYYDMTFEGAVDSSASAP